LPRILGLVTVILFSLIFFAWLFNKKDEPSSQVMEETENPIELSFALPERAVEPTVAEIPEPPKPTPPVVQEAPVDPQPIKTPADGLPDADRIEELFSTSGPKLPFIKTITYNSKVSWLRGRPAWIVDYANHYKTSRHFIARSLHGTNDYEKQDVNNGDRFNIYDPDVDLSFQLIVDISRCKMWLYANDKTNKERTLLKVYDVSLGRSDRSSPSGLLTPLGTYTLGNNIAIYKPGMNDFYKGKKTEMIRVFGTRWVPFATEVKDTTAPAKGLGIHGVPWVADGTTEQLHEDLSSLGHYDSDGCVRCADKDIKEIYAIIVTKPTTIQIVQDYSKVDLGVAR
jgi:hypothetical protein